VLTIEQGTNLSNSGFLIRKSAARFLILVLHRSSTAGLLGATGYTQKLNKILKVGTAATVHTSNTSDRDTNV